MAARGSCRHFRDEAVPDDMLETHCAIAFSAPTKSDLQQRDIVLIQSTEIRQRLADLANACPGDVKVEAHTDSEGFASMNAALSQARANAVRNALAALGVERERMRAIGYGESRPIVDDYTVEGRAANNRIVISVDEPE